MTTIAASHDRHSSDMVFATYNVLAQVRATRVTASLKISLTGVTAVLGIKLLLDTHTKVGTEEETQAAEAGE